MTALSRNFDGMYYKIQLSNHGRSEFEPIPSVSWLFWLSHNIFLVERNELSVILFSFEREFSRISVGTVIGCRVSITRDTDGVLELDGDCVVRLPWCTVLPVTFVEHPSRIRVVAVAWRSYQLYLPSFHESVQV